MVFGSAVISAGIGVRQGAPKSYFLFTLYANELVRDLKRRCVTGPHYESDRVIFTRLRLSSHDLAIEKGRWSRIPHENHLCPCGHVQTEEHIVCYCNQTAHVCGQQLNVNFQSLREFFDHPNLSEL